MKVMVGVWVVMLKLALVTLAVSGDGELAAVNETDAVIVSFVCVVPIDRSPNVAWPLVSVDRVVVPFSVPEDAEVEIVTPLKAKAAAFSYNCTTGEGVIVAFANAPVGCCAKLRE